MDEPSLRESRVTQLLHAWGRGDSAAGDELFAAVYDELHTLAARRMRLERAGNTLQASGSRQRSVCPPESMDEMLPGTGTARNSSSRLPHRLCGESW